jgi:hypothetical protein
MCRAQFASKCRLCKAGIAPGDDIIIQPGGARHENCRTPRKPDPPEQGVLPLVGDVPRRRRMMDLMEQKPAT